VGECRLCGYSKLDCKFMVNSIPIVSCVSCGFVQVNQKPEREDILSLYREDYFKETKYSENFAKNKEYERRMDLLSKHLPHDSVILECGCANGDFIEYSKSRYQMWGIELSNTAVHKARKTNPELSEKILCGFLHEQTLPDNFYDAIVMWDVVEHLWDPVMEMESFIDKLKPGGYLFISTPNIGAPLAKITGRYWPFMTVPEHLVFFSKKTIEKLCCDCLGMSVVSWWSKGKWANFAFILYKLKRIFPQLIPECLINIFRAKGFNKLSVYVPTGDIQYIVAIKNKEDSHD